MATPREKVSSVDPIWTDLRQQAEAMAAREPTLAGFVHATILQHDRLEQALSYHLARKLGGEDLSPLAIREMFDHAASEDGFEQTLRADLFLLLESETDDGQRRGRQRWRSAGNARKPHAEWQEVDELATPSADSRTLRSCMHRCPIGPMSLP